jgi:hypothetical protein
MTAGRLTSSPISSSTAAACASWVVDDCTRECLTLVADTSASGWRELDRLLVASR